MAIWTKDLEVRKPIISSIAIDVMNLKGQIPFWCRACPTALLAVRRFQSGSDKPSLQLEALNESPLDENSLQGPGRCDWDLHSPSPGHSFQV